MTEPAAGSDVAAIRTTARRESDGWILSGAKTSISNAIRADWTVVWATIDPAAGRARHRTFVVERGTRGLDDMRAEHKMGLIAYESASFTLRDCRVPAANLLGGEDYYRSRAGFKGAMESFNATRPVVAAMAVGIARAAYDAARRFARAGGALSGALPRHHGSAEKLGSHRAARSNWRGSCAGARRRSPMRGSRTRSKPRWRRPSPPQPRSRPRARRSRPWARRGCARITTSRSSTGT
jgi:acyl-CoA dehydrogenase